MNNDDMVNEFYCLWQKRGKGVPIAMDAVLVPQFNIDNPMPPMDYPWTRNRLGQKKPFPEKLWLVAKEKLLLFDYYPCFSGYIISKKFSKVLKKYWKNENSIQLVPLSTISWKGKEITEKEYMYLCFVNKESAIDYNLSEYSLDKDANMDFVMKMGYGIDKFNKIVIKTEFNNKNPFFELNDISYRNIMCCDANLMNMIKSNDLYGFDLVDISELPKLYNSRFKKY